MGGKEENLAIDKERIKSKIKKWKERKKERKKDRKKERKWIYIKKNWWAEREKTSNRQEKNQD